MKCLLIFLSYINSNLVKKKERKKVGNASFENFYFFDIFSF